jgi:hypothetical protein
VVGFSSKRSLDGVWSRATALGAGNMHSDWTRGQRLGFLSIVVATWGIPALAHGASVADVEALLDPADSPSLIVAGIESKSSVEVVSTSDDGFTVRYATLVAVDQDEGYPNPAVVVRSAAFRILFTVEDTADRGYTLFLSNRRVGTFTLVDEVLVAPFGAAAVLGPVQLIFGGDGVSVPLQVMDGGGLVSGGGSTGDIAFLNDQSPPEISFSGSGTRTYTLDLSWTGWVYSAGDEAAIRLGIPGSSATMTADDYPGPGDRIAAEDGHFVTLELVPEPDSPALLATMLASLLALSLGQRIGGSAPDG